MHDLPSQTLLQQKHAKPISGEHLEVLGKHAASQYMSGTCSTLNEAVVETVKQAGLSPEQVKRVIEFANTDAYLQEFKKEGSDHKYVHFQGGPASPSEVLKDLNDGGGGTVFDRGMGDYSSPPPDMSKRSSANLARVGMDKTASAYDPAERQLQEMFNVKEQPIPYADPWAESVAMRDKLAGARDNANSELGSLEVEFMTICDHLYHQVKQASLSEVPLGHVIQAWQDVVPGPEYVKLAFQRIGPRLIKEEVFPSRVAMGDSLTKTAAGIPDHSHPIIRTFAAFCTHLDKLAGLRTTRDELSEHYNRIDWFLKEGMKKHAQTKEQLKQATVSSAVSKGVKAVTGLADDAAGVVRRNVGGTAGDVLGTATKYTPHAAAALAGKEMYDRAKFNPITGGLVRAAKARVPGTQESYMRERRLRGM
jgi:hypothetical protein